MSRQAALEAQALVLEPESGFYSDPVVVLDFQSLYPSMMIAHNLDYSTIFAKLRRGREWEGTREGSETTERLGFLPYPERASAAAAAREGQSAYVSPNGSVFCSKESREGILPLMLKELLATRQMVKRSMALYQRNKAGAAEQRVLGDREHAALLRVLENRQLALKMLANVTYGYTSASYSGRMVRLASLLV